MPWAPSGSLGVWSLPSCEERLEEVEEPHAGTRVFKGSLLLVSWVEGGGGWEAGGLSGGGGARGHHGEGDSRCTQDGFGVESTGWAD